MDHTQSFKVAEGFHARELRTERKRDAIQRLTNHVNDRLGHRQHSHGEAAHSYRDHKNAALIGDQVAEE